MKNLVLLHIPHSSLKLTKEFKQLEKCISRDEINDFNFAMIDLYTDKLFSSNRYKHIKAKYSRICCDMEKFSNDNEEEMSKYGMGVVYTKTNQSKNLINPNDKYKKSILNKYYFPYHNKLNNLVNSALRTNKKTILIDCHSFSKEIIMNGKISNLPDICIGYNDYFEKDEQLLKITLNYFSNLGYNIVVNYPYSGAMIPNCLMKNRNKNFASIMIEINKNLYMNGLKKSQNFSKLKNEIFGYLTYVKKYEF